jgi:hypothetical protein
MRLLLVGLLSAALAVPSARREPHAAAGTPHAARASVPGAALRIARVQTYSMSGQIRPLLFWIGRDDIGLARLTWREGENGTRGYELLVGTDPAKAPRSLNRWGYIAEEIGSGYGAVLALMTGSPDTSYDEASTSGGGLDFRAIRNGMRESRAYSQLTRVHTPAVLTVHDLEAALDRVAHEESRARQVETTVAPDTRPGCLNALAELIELGAGRLPEPAADEADKPRPVRYVFGRKTYELRLRDRRAHVRDLYGHPTPLVTSSFEIKAEPGGDRTRFDVTFGTAGDFANLPVAAEWQPRWWLKVRIALAAGPAAGVHTEQ